MKGTVVLLVVVVARVLVRLAVLRHDAAGVSALLHLGQDVGYSDSSSADRTLKWADVLANGEYEYRARRRARAAAPNGGGAEEV